MKISLGLKSRIAYRRSVHCLNLLLKSRFGHHEEFSFTYQVVVKSSRFVIKILLLTSSIAINSIKMIILRFDSFSGTLEKIQTSGRRSSAFNSGQEQISLYDIATLSQVKVMHEN